MGKLDETEHQKNFEGISVSDIGEIGIGKNFRKDGENRIENRHSAIAHYLDKVPSLFYTKFNLTLSSKEWILLDSTLAFYITVLYKDFMRYTGHRLTELDLSFGQLPFLIYVGKSPGCTPSELTKYLQIDWGYSQRTLTKLTKSGFLRKEKNTENARVAHLYLTEKGQKAFSLGHEVFYCWDTELVKTLSEDEKLQLFTLLQKLVAGKERL